MPKPNLGNQYQNALDRVERLERKLVRAVNQWQKAKTEVKRIGKRMDKLQELI